VTALTIKCSAIYPHSVLYVLCTAHNKQQLFPQTALIAWSV